MALIDPSLRKRFKNKIKKINEKWKKKKIKMLHKSFTQERNEIFKEFRKQLKFNIKNDEFEGDEWELGEEEIYLNFFENLVFGTKHVTDNKILNQNKNDLCNNQ
jgi:hypothetical protein